MASLCLGLLALRRRPSAQGRRTGGQALPTTGQASLPGVRAPYPQSLSFLICGLRKTQPPRHEAQGWPEELTPVRTPRWSRGHPGVSASRPPPGRHALPAAPSSFVRSPSSAILLLLLTERSWGIGFQKPCGGPAAPSGVASSREGHGGPGSPRGGGSLKLPGFPQPYTLPWKPPSNHANRLCPWCAAAVWLAPGPPGVTLRTQGQAEDGEPWGQLVCPPSASFYKTSLPTTGRSPVVVLCGASVYDSRGHGTSALQGAPVARPAPC